MKINEKWDAYGHAMLDGVAGDAKHYVIERDDGAVEVCPIGPYLSGYDDWSPVARWAVDCARGAILDIGAGAGRHSLYLQNKGLRVTPSDNSPGAIDRARRLLKRLAGCTTSGAQIIAQTIDPYQTTNPLHLAYHKINQSKGRMSGQTRIRVRYKQYATPWLYCLFVSKQEMADIVDGTEWRIDQVRQADGPSYFACLQKATGILP